MVHHSLYVAGVYSGGASVTRLSGKVRHFDVVDPTWPICAAQINFQMYLNIVPIQILKNV